MKKIVSILLAMGALLSVRAQLPSDMPRPFRVYGIDFSQTKICGADESSYEFARAFQRINMLLYSESEKYDFERFLRAEVVSVDIEQVQQRNAAGEYHPQFSREITVASADLQQLVEAFEIEATQGTGVVLVALLLDKTNACAIYDVVFFDIPTRKVLAVYRKSGNAGGFGLRNYWARSVYEVLKSPIEKKAKRR